MLHFLETVGGSNVTIANVTVPDNTDLRNFSVNILFNQALIPLNILGRIKDLFAIRPVPTTCSSFPATSLSKEMRQRPASTSS